MLLLYTYIFLLRYIYFIIFLIALLLISSKFKVF